MHFPFITREIFSLTPTYGTSFMKLKTLIPMNKLTVSLGLALVILAGCDSSFPDSGPDEPPMYVTDILGVDMTPDPVVVGDTVTFTAIIRDSLKSGFTFRWVLGEIPGSGRADSSASTNTNQVQWITPDSAGRYLHSVTVFGDGPGQPVTKDFETTIIEVP